MGTARSGTAGVRYVLVREHDAVRESTLETTEQKEHHRDETA